MEKKRRKNWLVPDEPRVTAKYDFDQLFGKPSRPKGSKNTPEHNKKNQKPSVGDDESLQQLVEIMTACGMSKPRMAGLLRIHVDTLNKNFAHQLENGKFSANMRMAQALYRKGIEGDVRAGMFWLKSQAGFVEKTEIEIKGNLADNMSVTEKGQRLARIMLSDPALLAKYKKPKTPELPPAERPPIDIN